VDGSPLPSHQGAICGGDGAGWRVVVGVVGRRGRLRIRCMCGSPVLRILAAQDTEMSSSLASRVSMCAMASSFSWLLPWQAPVILRSALYSTPNGFQVVFDPWPVPQLGSEC